MRQRKLETIKLLTPDETARLSALISGKRDRALFLYCLTCFPRRSITQVVAEGTSRPIHS